MNLDTENVLRWGWMAFILFGVLFAGKSRRFFRKRRFTRGRQLVRAASHNPCKTGSLRWGSLYVPESSATRHFLVAGTTGSGKSLVQRLLMKDVLHRIGNGKGSRAVIFDAKSDAVPFLEKLGVKCPILSLNPFESRDNTPSSASWDIATDISSPSRAINLAASLIPAERSGGNQYFTDAARQVVSGVIESFIRHSPGRWSFSDLVWSTMSIGRVKDVLSRDAFGRETLENFFGDERTAYQVFTTVVSRMSYFRPVAALWQGKKRKISLCQWLTEESILLLGSNRTAKTALDAINDIVFRVLVEEIDVQCDSSSRRTWVWIDEARLSGPLLRCDLLPYLCVKGRSKGACLVLGFQDIEGLREAAGPRVANEIIAQCSHKALLRMESEESAAWASRVLGQFETLDFFRSEPTLGRLSGGTISEHFARRDAVLPSEFFMIPVTSLSRGLSGFFVVPDLGAVSSTVPPKDLEPLVVSEEEAQDGFLSRPESDQWLRPWAAVDELRLGLCREPEPEEPKPRPALRLKRKRGAELDSEEPSNLDYPTEL